MNKDRQLPEDLTDNIDDHDLVADEGPAEPFEETPEEDFGDALDEYFDMTPDEYDEYFDHTPDDDLDEPPARPSPWLRLTALITVIAFLGLVAVTSWPNHKLSLTDLVIKSFQLKRSTNADLAQAVVQINVLTRQGATVIMEQKAGTGFNIDPSGVIITNHHVIENSVNMTITFPDGKVYNAARWASKPESDLAVIVLRAAGLPAVPVNTAKPPAPGDQVKVVGNPLTLNNIMVEGTIGQYLRVMNRQGRVFSIDAPIYPGNSGSPVFNMKDQVIGVVFGSVRWEEDGQEKVAGLAVSIDEARELIHQESGLNL